MKTFAVMAALLAFPIMAARADVTLAKIIGDHMVLQRDRSVPIWGKADAGEKVTVTFGKATASTTADAQGQWQVAIATGPASDAPAELTVTGKNTLTIKDVLVGEVWICSGQSNMEYPLNRAFLNGTPPPPAGVTDISTQEFKTAHEPLIRTLKVERQLNTPELPTDGWHECGGTSLEHFSAIGYFFGKDLHAELKVPIGLIQSAWAGSRIEPWIPVDAYKNSPALKEDAAKTPGRLDGSPVGNYYSKIVAPLAPFAVRGVIWYQGESNIITTNDGMRYFDKFAAMVDAWRTYWHDPDMAFIQIGLAPFAYSKRNAANEAAHPVTALPEFWGAQQYAADHMKNVGMVVITDLADAPTNIHPWNKWDVGKRVTAWALAREYGRNDVAFHGPLFQHIEIQDGKAIIIFDTGDRSPDGGAGGGLTTRDGKPPTDFEIAGADGKFVPAEAKISGDRIAVSSPAVKEPKTVRFAWTELAIPNLTNRGGLPAESFRTNASQINTGPPRFAP